MLSDDITHHCQTSGLPRSMLCQPWRSTAQSLGHVIYREHCKKDACTQISVPITYSNTGLKAHPLTLCSDMVHTNYRESGWERKECLTIFLPAAFLQHLTSHLSQNFQVHVAQEYVQLLASWKMTYVLIKCILFIRHFFFASQIFASHYNKLLGNKLHIIYTNSLVPVLTLILPFAFLIKMQYIGCSPRHKWTSQAHHLQMLYRFLLMTRTRKSKETALLGEVHTQCGQTALACGHFFCKLICRLEKWLISPTECCQAGI